MATYLKLERGVYADGVDVRYAFLQHWALIRMGLSNNTQSVTSMTKGILVWEETAKEMYFL